ncbi:uncharacterized protein LOC136076646 isoform X2 [Hydra vulgaris]
MATRQITGSKELIKILSGFGHCISYSATMRYETALASINLKEDVVLPQGTKDTSLSILVWDNIDFGEERRSGKGTNHMANEIIVQPLNIGPTQEKKEITVSKRPRTIQEPLSSILPYQIGKKESPKLKKLIEKINIDLVISSISIEKVKDQDRAYLLCKSQIQENSFPSWTAFNIGQNKAASHVSYIGYLPVVDAPVTDIATIYTILCRSVDIINKLNLKYGVVVCDEAVYSKIQMVRWKEPEFSNRFVVRLGEFHTMMSFMTAIAKRFDVSGFKDIVIKSGLVAEGAVKGILTGKHYNRSIMVHKIMFEALSRLRFESFLNSLDVDNRHEVEDFCLLLMELHGTSEFQWYIESGLFVEIRERYDEFVKISSERSSTFKFWSSYIDMVWLMLLFLRATRTTNWELHLDCVRMMLPWYFAYDRVNYARCLCPYWLEMKAIDSTHQGLLTEFKNNWTVQRQASSFSAIACDQAIEQTCNRDCKTNGGITGNTLNRGAVQRWILSQPERSLIAQQCKLLSGYVKESRVCKDLDVTRIRKDEKSVIDVMETVSSMINPFENEVTNDLVNIVTGIVAEGNYKRSRSSLPDRRQKLC